MYPSGHPSLQPAAAGCGRAAPSNCSPTGRRSPSASPGASSSSKAWPPTRRSRCCAGSAKSFTGIISARSRVLRGVTPTKSGRRCGRCRASRNSTGRWGSAPDEDRTWPHLRLHPLSFGGLALVGDAALTAEPGWQGRRHAGRGIVDWPGPRGDGRRARGDAAPETEPTVVARAIDEHPRVEAYDQVVIGYLLQIARELRTSAAGPRRRRAAAAHGAPDRRAEPRDAAAAGRDERRPGAAAPVRARRGARHGRGHRDRHRQGGGRRQRPADLRRPGAHAVEAGGARGAGKRTERARQPTSRCANRSGNC